MRFQEGARFQERVRLLDFQKIPILASDRIQDFQEIPREGEVPREGETHEIVMKSSNNYSFGKDLISEQCLRQIRLGKCKLGPN